jgi:hypothetical protein
MSWMSELRPNIEKFKKQLESELGTSKAEHERLEQGMKTLHRQMQVMKEAQDADHEDKEKIKNWIKTKLGPNLELIRDVPRAAASPGSVKSWLSGWLRELGMEEYIEQFSKNGCEFRCAHAHAHADQYRRSSKRYCIAQ